MTVTGKKPQKKIPYEIREDPSDSVASTSQAKSLLRKQVQVLRHTLSLVRDNLSLHASQAIVIIIIIIIIMIIIIINR